MPKIRPATPLDLLGLWANRRRQRVFRLNPPYTLVQPESMLLDMLKAQAPIKPQASFVYVYIDNGIAQGYVEVRSKWRKRDEWTITTLSSTDRADDVLEALLEEVCRTAGEAGVTRLFVKIPRDEPQLALFRTLGFTHYTSEGIWGNLYFGTSSAQADKPPSKPLRRQTNGDSWDLMQLYSAVTPPAVQRAEVLTSRQWQVSHMPRNWPLSDGLTEASYVWPDAREKMTGLGGYIRLLTGARGHWITLLFRSDSANRAVCPTALDYVLWKAARAGNKPVYSGVREYQAEIAGLLEERGFHCLSEQALLVKYLAEPIKEQQPALVPFLVPKPREMAATDFRAASCAL